MNPKNQAFAIRLQDLMDRKGLSQSELARMIWGTRTDPSTGYPAAAGRDRISSYLSAKQFPKEKTLRLIADALGVTVDHLKPERPLPRCLRECPYAPH